MSTHFRGGPVLLPATGLTASTRNPLVFLANPLAIGGGGERRYGASPNRGPTGTTTALPAYPRVRGWGR